MSAISQIEKEIREAVVFLRENNQTTPSATIQFMKDASIEKLNQGQTLPVDSVIVPKGTLPFEFMEWYSGMHPHKIRNAYNRWQKEKGNAL
jgi:hypothetical protein